MTGDRPDTDDARQGAVGVLVIDDQPFFRVAARAVIDTMPGFELVGSVASGREGIEAAAELHPGLVLLDVQMPGMDGIEAARRIRRGHSSAVIVLLSVDDTVSGSPAFATCGASAFVRKEDFGRGTLSRLWAVHGRHAPSAARAARPSARLGEEHQRGPHAL